MTQNENLIYIIDQITENNLTIQEHKNSIHKLNTDQFKLLHELRKQIESQEAL
jgi:hypothetical protein